MTYERCRKCEADPGRDGCGVNYSSLADAWVVVPGGDLCGTCAGHEADTLNLLQKVNTHRSLRGLTPLRSLEA